MTIHQPIYMSEPFGFDDGILNGILSISRRNNARNGITGALVRGARCRTRAPTASAAQSTSSDRSDGKGSTDDGESSHGQVLLPLVMQSSCRTP